MLKFVSPARRCAPLLYAGLASIAMPAFAQQARPADAADLQGVVVTASGFQQAIDDAPASITILTRQQLETQPFRDLTDALRHVEGISITGSGSNAQDINIRGMPGGYTLILVDGHRQGTRESRPNGDGGFEAGWIPPLSAIERIEVVRGPMSSLYGSDAIGGVINVITRKVPTQWSGALGLDGTLQQHAHSGDSQQGTLYLAGPLSRQMGLQLYGGQNQRDEDRILNGFARGRNRNANARLSFAPGANQSVELAGTAQRQDRWLTAGRSLAPCTLRGTVCQPNASSRTQNNRDAWSLSHSGHWSFGDTDLSFQRETGQRITTQYSTDGSGAASTDPRQPKIVNTVIDGKASLPFERHTLTVGAQVNRARLHDASQTGPGSSVQTQVEARQNAVFAEDELRLRDDLQLTTGARLDDHSRYGHHWSPRAYLVWHLDDRWTLKGGAAKAFRAPSLREVSPTYGTATQGGLAIMYGNPDLKPETSLSRELSLNYDNHDDLAAHVTLYDNDFRNKLSNYPTGGRDPRTGLSLWVFDNVGKTRLRGVETGMQWRIRPCVTLSANYTYTDSRRLSDDEQLADGSSLRGEPLWMTPKHLANLRIDYLPTDPLTLWLGTQYRSREVWGAQRNGYSGLRYSPALTLVDLGASWKVTPRLRLNAAIYNVGDKVQPLDALGGNWEVIDGRRLWLGANIEF